MLPQEHCLFYSHVLAAFESNNVVAAVMHTMPEGGLTPLIIEHTRSVLVGRRRIRIEECIEFESHVRGGARAPFRINGLDDVVVIP